MHSSLRLLFLVGCNEPCAIKAAYRDGDIELSNEVPYAMLLAQAVAFGKASGMRVHVARIIFVNDIDTFSRGCTRTCDVLTPPSAQSSARRSSSQRASGVFLKNHCNLPVMPISTY